MYLNKKQKEIPQRSNIEKQKYEEAVIECKKLHSFIKNMVERKIAILSKQDIIMPG